LDRSRRFCRDVLGLAIYREYGPLDGSWVVFLLAPGLLKVSEHKARPRGRSVMMMMMMMWIQVRNVRPGHVRLTAGVPVIPGADSGALGPDRDVDRRSRRRPDRLGREFPPITSSPLPADEDRQQMDGNAVGGTSRPWAQGADDHQRVY
jgi:hypothetical protein